MKKILAIVAMLYVFSTAISLSAENSVTAVENGRPSASIYLSEDINRVASVGVKPSVKKVPIELEDMRTAVFDLKYHFKKMSGTELQVVITDKPEDIKRPAIVLGKLAVSLGAVPEKSPTQESFRIIVKDGMILIGGESDAGTMYGVYELLNKLGCDWIMPGEIGEIIPKKDTISIPFMDKTQKPDYLIRSPWYSGGKYVTQEEYKQFDQWKKRHKQQTGENPFKMKGGHVWEAVINAFKEEFKNDPSMLALVRASNGELVRKGPQFDTAHPKVLELFIKYIDGIFKKNRLDDNADVCLSYSPSDGLGYSISAESIALGVGRNEAMSGGPDVTDQLILFGNQILDATKNKHPNLHLGFYLYGAHGEYPSKYKPDPRIVPIIADINFSRYHSMLDENSKSRNYSRSILNEWGKLHKEQGNRIQFRGYNWNLSEAILPYTKLEIWGKDIPYYYSLGCQGSYTEWFKGWSVTGPSDYLEVRMNWNTKLDWKNVLKEYCVKSYGKAAPFMEEYYLYLVKVQRDAGQEAGSFSATHLIFTHDFVSKANELFDKAQNAADTDQNKKLVEYMRLPLRLLSLYLDYHDAITAFCFNEAVQKLEEMNALMEKYYSIDSNLVCKQGFHYLNNRILARPAKEAKKYSTGNYKIIFPLPDKMKTMLDPNMIGAQMGFQKTSINDSNFILTSTYSTTWDAQGLSGYRDGCVWYRQNFNVDKSLEGKPIGLIIGGVDDIVRVWINGKYIGMGRGYCMPFLFDLTDDIKYGQDNLLAFQVERNFKTTELGLGGIILPSFVFTGPRLEKKAPSNERLRRILSGGTEGELE